MKITFFIITTLGIFRIICSSFVPWTKKDTFYLSKNLNDNEDMNRLLENTDFFDLHIFEPGYLEAMKKCIELKIENFMAAFNVPQAYKYDFTKIERKKNLIKRWEKKEDYISWKRLYSKEKMRNYFVRACLELRSFTDQVESPTEILSRIESSVSNIVSTRNQLLLDSPAVVDCSILFKSTEIPTKIAAPVKGSSFLVLLETDQVTEYKKSSNMRQKSTKERHEYSADIVEKPSEKLKLTKKSVDKGKLCLEDKGKLPKNYKSQGNTKGFLENSFMDTEYRENNKMLLKDACNMPKNFEFLDKSQLHLEKTKNKYKYSEYPDISAVDIKKAINKPKNYVPIDTIHPRKDMEIADQSAKMNLQPMEIDDTDP